MNAIADSIAGTGTGDAATEAAATGLVNGEWFVAEPGLGLDQDKGSGLDQDKGLGQWEGETVKRSRGRPQQQQHCKYNWQYYH